MVSFKEKSLLKSSAKVLRNQPLRAPIAQKLLVNGGFCVIELFKKGSYGLSMLNETSREGDGHERFTAGLRLRLPAR
jgi:hypothetical protein